VAAGVAFPKGDGVDTLWNFENARFCTATDAVTKLCTTWEDHRLSDLTGVTAPLGALASLNVGGLTFTGQAVVAGPTSPKTVTLTNTGGDFLAITSASITGTNASSFGFTATCNGSLAAGASCNYNVTFDPTAAGPLSASLNIVTSVGTSTVALSGTGISNSPATGAPAISDTTPTQGRQLTASLGTVVDPDGIPATVTYTWRSSSTATGAIQPAVVATGATFTPPTANRRLQVTISFVDNAGTSETLNSAITSVVGELFNGGTGADTRAGTAGQDEYHGGAGNDNLSGTGENDLISGDAGNDTISTGAGNDVVTFSGTNEEFDAVTGGAGSDVIVPLAPNTTIGLRSISTIEGIDGTGMGNNINILGSANGDALNFTNVVLTNIRSIDGGGGNDQITGSAGDDWIIGRAGTDTLNGGPGTDIIDGGAGNDTLRGGLGNDTFKFAAGFGNDTIPDFDANPTGGQDKIDLRGMGLTYANITHTAGSNTVITVPGGGTIRLSGVNGPAITADDFIFV